MVFAWRSANRRRWGHALYQTDLHLKRRIPGWGRPHTLDTHFRSHGVVWCCRDATRGCILQANEGGVGGQDEDAKRSIYSAPLWEASSCIHGDLASRFCVVHRIRRDGSVVICGIHGTPEVLGPKRTAFRTRTSSHKSIYSHPVVYFACPLVYVCTYRITSIP